MISTRLTVLAALAAGALVISSGAHSTANASSGSTLRLVERGGAVKFVDLPPRARHQFDFSAGDLAIVTRTLYTASGARAGSLELSCVTVTAEPKQQCTGTIELGAGTIEVAGLSRPSPTTSFAVTGGTGSHADATGTGFSKDRPGNGNIADLTLRLS